MPLVSTKDAISAAIKKDGVVPDVIEEFPVTTVLDVSYGPDKDLRFGNELKVNDTQKLPTVTVAVTEFPSDPTYTLVMTDPDAPRRGDPTWSEFCHYVVTDIKLDPSKVGQPQEINFSNATDLIDYMGPGPPVKTGLHRYVFILFEGATKDTPPGRRNWGLGTPGAGVRQWLKSQTLKPTGINFFVAQNEIQ